MGFLENNTQFSIRLTSRPGGSCSSLSCKGTSQIDLETRKVNPSGEGSGERIYPERRVSAQLTVTKGSF